MMPRLSSALLAIFTLSACSSLFGEDFGDEFSRAVGWEKPEIDDKDIKASPPLTVPQDYALIAPAGGGEPPLEQPRKRAAPIVEKRAVPDARKPDGFDSYGNVPEGLRTQFDRSLDRYTIANRDGLGERQPRRAPRQPAFTRNPATPQVGGGAATRILDRKPSASGAIASEAVKPETHEENEGSPCEKVAVRNGTYRCLD